MRIERRSEFDQRSPIETPVREVASEDLMEGERVLNIRHGDALYTLRLTRQGKLLLTK